MVLNFKVCVVEKKNLKKWQKKVKKGAKKEHFIFVSIMLLLKNQLPMLNITETNLKGGMRR